MIRVMPRVADANYFHVEDSITSSNAGTKSQHRGKTLESKQSSVEIALMTCNGFAGVDQSKKI